MYYGYRGPHNLLEFECGDGLFVWECWKSVLAEKYGRRMKMMCLNLFRSIQKHLNFLWPLLWCRTECLVSHGFRPVGFQSEFYFFKSSPTIFEHVRLRTSTHGQALHLVISNVLVAPFSCYCLPLSAWQTSVIWNVAIKKIVQRKI